MSEFPFSRPVESTSTGPVFPDSVKQRYAAEELQPAYPATLEAILQEIDLLPNHVPHPNNGAQKLGATLAYLKTGSQSLMTVMDFQHIERNNIHQIFGGGYDEITPEIIRYNDFPLTIVTHRERIDRSYRLVPPKDIAEPNDLVQYYWIYSAPIEQRQEAEYKPVAYRVASSVISFADVHLLTSGVDGEEFKLAREQSGNFHLVTEAEARILLQQIQTGMPK